MVPPSQDPARPRTVLLEHGAGGLASQDLIESMMLQYLPDPRLHRLEDAAVLAVPGGRLALSTDSYVVDPLFFPGGDIGELAINGTINDLAMQGADPCGLSLGLILEEGFPLAELERVMASIGRVCEQTGVPVVTGDTKVVPRGKGDRIFINTAGIGMVSPDVSLGTGQIREGDGILVTGSMGDHGLTILTCREGLRLHGDLQSDTCALHRLIQTLLRRFGREIHAMRDPTRGGLATTLAEMARAASLCFEIDEGAVPVLPPVRAGCEIMGLDPFYLANEGKCVLFVARKRLEQVLAFLRSSTEGRKAAQIGFVSRSRPGRVILHTTSGGQRLMESLSGEPLPRIC